MVTEQDVRELLSDISTARVSPATIEKQIEIANTTVENERGENASEETLEDARLIIAGWLTLNAYANRLERSAGRVPPNIVSQLAFYERLKDQFIIYIKRESGLVLTPMVDQPDTLATQAIDGELDGDYY